MTETAHKVSRGAVVLSAAQLVIKFVDLIALTVLARILLPDDFGLTAIAITTLAVVRAATDLPVANALVSKASVSESDIDTAFTVSVLRGMIVGLLLAALALPLSMVYADDRLVAVILAVAFAPLAKGFESGRKVLLLRDLHFRPIALSDLLAKTMSFVIAISVVIVTESYWAIVAGIVVTQWVATIASYVYAPYRPRFSMIGAGSLLRFAGWLTLSQALATFNVQGDRYFVGAILGVSALGLYAMAGTVAQTATFGLVLPVVQPLLAGLSRVAADPVRLRRAYVLCQQTLAAAVLPVGVLLGFSAPRVLPIVFGPDWVVASQLLVWLGPIVALQTLSLPVYSLALVLDRTKWLAGRDLSYIIIRLGPTVAAATLWGLQGAVIARTAIGVLQFLINLRIGSSLVGLPVAAQLRALRRTLWSLAAMGCALALLGGIDVSASTEIAAIAWTALVGAAGVAVYGAVHWSLWMQADRPDGPEAKMAPLVRKLSPTGRSVSSGTTLPVGPKPDHHVVLKEMQP